MMLIRFSIVWMVLYLAGCSSPGYVLDQAWVQLKILNHRQKIETILHKKELPPDQREKLEMVLDARQYAHEEMGLRLTAAYTRFYDTGGKPLAYNLSACPKDQLQPKAWRFPIVGQLPYIGFFDKHRALAAQQILEKEGYDTELRPVPAFSSLGWFADPVYSPMLEDDIARLVEVVIHETTHTTIFLRHQIAFNESLAVFVGNQGTLNFLALKYGLSSDEVTNYQQVVRRRHTFSRLISEVYGQLDTLYRSSISREQKLLARETLFKQAQTRYRQLFPDPKIWSNFVRRPLNNAIFLNYGRYNQGIEFHFRVYQALGRNLRRMIELYKFAQKFDDPITYVARICKLQGFIKQRL